jgi:hypothetical protein
VLLDYTITKIFRKQKRRKCDPPKCYYFNEVYLAPTSKLVCFVGRLMGTAGKKHSSFMNSKEQLITPVSVIA